MELEKVDKVMKISIEEFEKVIKFKGITETKSGCEKKHQQMDQMDHQNCKLEVSKHEETLRN
ncbi:16971_t:CDS:2, partial [Funneliformis geosporum]